MRGIAVEQGKFHWRRASREPGVGSRSASGKNFVREERARARASGEPATPRGRGNRLRGAARAPARRSTALQFHGDDPATSATRRRACVLASAVSVCETTPRRCGSPRDYCPSAESQVIARLNIGQPRLCERNFPTIHFSRHETPPLCLSSLQNTKHEKKKNQKNSCITL